jgi:hypothetical protein
MYAAQLGSEHRYGPQEQDRINIDQWAREGEQRNAQQPNRRRRGKPSVRLKPACIFQLGDKLGGKASQHDRYSENCHRSSHGPRYGGDVIADESRENQNRPGSRVRQADARSKLRGTDPGARRQTLRDTDRNGAGTRDSLTRVVGRSPKVSSLQTPAGARGIQTPCPSRAEYICLDTVCRPEGWKRPVPKSAVLGGTGSACCLTEERTGEITLPI